MEQGGPMCVQVTFVRVTLVRGPFVRVRTIVREDNCPGKKLIGVLYYARLDYVAGEVGSEGPYPRSSTPEGPSPNYFVVPPCKVDH